MIRTATPSIPARPFSIIELIVVITIIAILISVLLVALRPIRDAAPDIVCRNNLRQIGIAIVAYRDDHDGLLPLATDLIDVPAGEPGLAGSLAAYLDSPLPRVVDGEVIAPRLFVCPADATRTDDGTSYVYLVGGFLRNFAASEFINPELLRSVTANHEANPGDAILRDDEFYHVRGERRDRNGLLIDGSIRSTTE